MHRAGWIMGIGLGTLSLLAAWGSPAMAQKPARPASGTADWRKVLAERLPAYGHRNWIVIADSAYPAQARDAIETIATGAGQLEVLEAVLAAIRQAKHVRPVVYLDAELPHVPEADAPGIGKYRADLDRALAGRPVRSLPHEAIIKKLDEAGRTFRVLVLKTDLVLPYTSVFLELDCGYWSPEAEQRLREAMPARRGAAPEPTRPTEGRDPALPMKLFGTMGKEGKLVPGEEKVLFEHSGAGTLTHMWFGCESLLRTR